MGIKKDSCSIEEYQKEFKFIYDNLVAINKPVSDLDKVFQFARGLGNQYRDFNSHVDKSSISILQPVCPSIPRPQTNPIFTL